MKHTPIRLTAILLCSAFILTACAKPVQAPLDSPDTTAADTTEAVETELSDDIPELNFDGANYNILVRTSWEYEFDIEEETGDPINDIIYRRDGGIEDRFNIEITHAAVQSDWANNAFNNALNATIMAGDDAYSTVAGYAAMILGAIQKNYYINWYEMPYINLDKPWWSEQIAENFTINGKLFAMTGDLALSLWKSMITIFFNKTLAESYQAPDLYAIVRDGGWTFTRMVEICNGVSDDVDGNGKYDLNDLYGYSTGWSTAIDAYLAAFNLPILSHTADGSLEYTLVSDKMVAAMDMINAFINDTNYAFMDANADMTTIFKADRSLFYPNNLSVAEALRDMDTDYGIVPYPKYDEAQENYYSTSTDGFSLFLIPATVENRDMVGAVTEALCAESNKQVVPLYYDVVLKDKYARDAESSEMLDIIRDSLTFDIGYINSYALNTVGHYFVQLIRDNKSTISSKFASNEKKCLSTLEAMLEAYTD